MSHELIKEALDQACSLVKQKYSPTDALAKVASSYDLNPHFCRRVGELLNVALNLHHFKYAADKAAKFPIADIEEAVKKSMLFEREVPLKKKAEYFPSLDVQTKIPDFNRSLNDPLYKEAYLQFSNDVEQGSVNNHEMLFDTAVKKAHQDISKMKLVVDELQHKQHSTKLAFEGAYGELIEHFKRAEIYRTPWAEIERQLFAKHGSTHPEVTEYLDNIYKCAQLKEKRGEHNPRYWMFELCKEASMIEKLIEKGMELCDLETKYAEAKEDLAIGKNLINQIWKEANVVDQVEVSKEVPIEKLSFSLGDYILKNIESSLDKKEDKANPFKNEIGDNTRRRLLLQELMMIDPIISKADPKKVKAAYEQLMRVAPEISTEKEITRSALREMLASQALNAHTSNLFSEADLNLMKQKLLRAYGSQTAQPIR